MYKYYNPNPIKNNRVGDCVVRAISKVLNQSWEETYIELCLLGYVMGDWGSSNAVWNTYLKRKGFKRNVIPDDCPGCYTLEDFCNEHPQGSYIIGTGTHCIAIIDGTIFDTWNSNGEVPIYYYKKGE